MMTSYAVRFKKFFSICLFVAGASILVAQPAAAQTNKDAGGIQGLRSDVGINGLTANFHFLNDFHYMGNDTLNYDGSSELEFVFRDVRMLSPRLGVGFNVLTSFFVNDAKGEPSFGVGSWGLGPVVRAYPFKNLDRFQPYLQANMLIGNNMALGKMANTEHGGDGFRMRLGLRGGVAYRFTNNFGIFVEGGPDWGSPRIFRSDSRAWQINIGLDVYRFK